MLYYGQRTVVSNARLNGTCSDGWWRLMGDDHPPWSTGVTYTTSDDHWFTNLTFRPVFHPSLLQSLTRVVYYGRRTVVANGWLKVTCSDGWWRLTDGDHPSPSIGVPCATSDDHWFANHTLGPVFHPSLLQSLYAHAVLWAENCCFERATKGDVLRWMMEIDG